MGPRARSVGLMVRSRPLVLAATVLTSAALLGAVACSKQAPPPPPPQNALAAEPGPVDELPAGVSDGALWTCALDDYEPQPCKFHREGEVWHLTKVMGSQRFTTTAAFTTAGIELVGQFFCPWGECDDTIATTLTVADRGYAGRVAGSQLRLWWDAGNAGEYGGAGYGGLTGRETD